MKDDWQEINGCLTFQILFQIDKPLIKLTTSNLYQLHWLFGEAKLHQRKSLDQLDKARRTFTALAREEKLPHELSRFEFAICNHGCN